MSTKIVRVKPSVEVSQDWLYAYSSGLVRGLSEDDARCYATYKTGEPLPESMW